MLLNLQNQKIMAREELELKHKEEVDLHCAYVKVKHELSELKRKYEELDYKCAMLDGRLTIIEAITYGRPTLTPKQELKEAFKDMTEDEREAFIVELTSVGEDKKI